MMSNVVEDKSFEFAVDIIKAARKLRTATKEHDLASQLQRSGTSIGANVREAQRAQTGKDFVFKMSIASKEASETVYWLKLLEATELINREEAKPLLEKALELQRILISIVKTKQERLKTDK